MCAFKGNEGGVRRYQLDWLQRPPTVTPKLAWPSVQTHTHTCTDQWRCTVGTTWPAKEWSETLDWGQQRAEFSCWDWFSQWRGFFSHWCRGSYTPTSKNRGQNKNKNLEHLVTIFMSMKSRLKSDQNVYRLGFFDVLWRRRKPKLFLKLDGLCSKN